MKHPVVVPNNLLRGQFGQLYLAINYFYLNGPEQGGINFEETIIKMIIQDEGVTLNMS